MTREEAIKLAEKCRNSGERFESAIPEWVINAIMMAYTRGANEGYTAASPGYTW
jgi:hypothetical protein